MKQSSLEECRGQVVGYVAGYKISSSFAVEQTCDQFDCPILTVSIRQRQRTQMLPVEGKIQFGECLDLLSQGIDNKEMFSFFSRELRLFAVLILRRYAKVSLKSMAQKVRTRWARAIYRSWRHQISPRTLFPSFNFQFSSFFYFHTTKYRVNRDLKIVEVC